LRNIFGKTRGYWLPDWYIIQITNRWKDFIVNPNDQNPDATLIRNSIGKTVFYTNYTDGLEEFKNFGYAGVLFKFDNKPLLKITNELSRYLLSEFYVYRSFVNTAGDCTVKPDYYNQEIIKAYSVAYYNMGIRLLSTTKTAVGDKELQTCAFFDPGFDLAYWSLGLLYYQKQMYVQSEKYYRLLVQLKPDDSKSRNALGVVFVQLGKIDNAVQQLEHAARLNPTAEIYNNLGGAYFKQNNKQKAVESYQKSLQIDPNYADAQRNYQTVLKSLQ
jgi:tetratricopeptide (TPR) repeat protein